MPSAELLTSYGIVPEEIVYSTVAIDAVNAAIEDQNGRLEQARITFSGEPDFLKLAVNGIAKEQKASFTNLLETSSAIPYEQLGELDTILDTQVASVQGDLNKTQTTIAEQEEKIRIKKAADEERALTQLTSLVEQMKQISPEAVVDAENLVTARLAKLPKNPEIVEAEKNISQLGTLIATLQEKLNDLTDTRTSLDSLLTTSWPIPQAIRPDREYSRYTKNVSKNNSRTAEVAVPKELPWEKDLRRKVGEAITMLETEGLLPLTENEAIKAVTITKSRIMATRTSVQKLMAAKLIGSNAQTRVRAKTEFSAYEIILMQIFNTTPELSSKGSQIQTKATEIIKYCLTRYYENRRQREQAAKDDQTGSP